MDRRRFLAISGAGIAAATLAACGSSSSSSNVKVNEPKKVAPPKLSPDYQPPPSDTLFDVVILGGRVMDPESKFDAVANVGILGDKISLISTDDLTGKTAIDASGHVVSPGFIDILSYEPNSYGIWYKVGDGVTTNLGMHGIKDPVDATRFFNRYNGKVPINFGGAFSDQWYRDSIGIRGEATPSQLSRLRDSLEQQIDSGWIGLSIDPEYAPSITTTEYIELSKVAEANKIPLFTHVRASSPPQSLDAIAEVLRVGRETGVSVHIDHIPSMATFVMEQALELIEEARSEGLDVTGCFYPYNFWGTYLASARFAGDWQSRFRISYNDLQLAGSSERLTADSFRRYQAQNKLVVAYAIPQGDVDMVARSSWSMVGSDAIPESSNNNHPRGAGCFARALGPYVRDMKLYSLMDGISKCTLQPANRTGLSSKGRVQMNADADLCIFDPNTIADTSTVEKPAQYSTGIDWVIVNGKVAKTSAGVQTTTFAGKAVGPN